MKNKLGQIKTIPIGFLNNNITMVLVKNVLQNINFRLVLHCNTIIIISRVGKPYHLTKWTIVILRKGQQGQHSRGDGHNYANKLLSTSKMQYPLKCNCLATKYKNNNTATQAIKPLFTLLRQHVICNLNYRPNTTKPFK